MPEDNRDVIEYEPWNPAPAIPEHLLDEAKTYLAKPKRELIQLDGFTDASPDDYVMRADEDGDACFIGETTERQLSDTTVRILIDKHASREDVIRILAKLTDPAKFEHWPWTSPSTTEAPY